MFKLRSGKALLARVFSMTAGIAAWVRRGYPLPVFLSLVSLFCLSDGLPPGSSGAADSENISLVYRLDRSALPDLTYRDITLKIFIGPASAISANGDGKPLDVRYDSQSGFALVTTSAVMLQVNIAGGTLTPQTGTFTRTVLKDDLAWAWSHSFDDNRVFKERGIPAFDQYGYRATVYLIGKDIDEVRDEGWIIDRPDLVKLLNKGWGIGNHTWSHQYVADIGGASAARQDILLLHTYLRQLADEAGHPDYRFIAFAAPMFDSDYHPIVQSLREEPAHELLFNESGNRGIYRVDPGADEKDFYQFDPYAPLGRDGRVDEFGSGSDQDQEFRADVSKMTANLNSTRHYWLNTFTHWVDDRPADQSIFGFLAWIDQNYGVQSSHPVWVAPAEEIYSYMVVRDGIKITFSIGEPPVLNQRTFLPLISS